MKYRKIKDELKEFANEVKNANGQNVLDLGCGSGIQSKQLIDEGLKVVGLDISPKMVAEARKRVPRAKFVVGDMAKLPFKKDSFDGVYARASLLHIPKDLIPKVLGLISKILVNGGYFYLALKKGQGEGEVEDERHERKVRRFFSFFNEEEVEDLLKDSGFNVEKINTLQRLDGSTIWIQVLARKS